MSIDLTINSPVSENPQSVQDQDGNTSALAIATNSVKIYGQDIEGSTLPLVVQGGDVATGTTYGRLIRLGGYGTFFDIGIDENGNLFFNAPNAQSPAEHVLTVSKDGVITLGASGAVTIR